MRKLTQKIWKANQSWHYEALWQVNDRRIKISIRRNAFDEQNHCVAKMFDGDKWNGIASTPHSRMNCNHLSYMQPNPPTVKDFQTDEDILLAEVKMILGDKE